MYKYTIKNWIKMTTVFRHGISSLRGQGNFYFTKGTSIGKSNAYWETFEGAPQPNPGAAEAKAFMAIM